MGSESKSDDGVAEWEAGLPSPDDLTPLSQSLIPPELASAFKISPEPTRTSADVHRAAQTALSSLSGAPAAATFKPFGGGSHVDDHVMDEVEMEEEGSDPKRGRRMDSDDDPAAAAGAKTLKRPRLVWTPQLHKRFVDVVGHLGLKNAVPKTIMQLMNVEGLTRENVASHLQKYRLYVKRMQGLSNDGPSPSDHLFASTPVPPQSFNESSNSGGATNHGNGIGSHGSGGNGSSGNHVGMPIPMPYPPPPPPPTQIMSMQMMGMNNGYPHYGHHYQQQYSSMMQQQRDWSGNGYPHQVSHHQNNSKC